MSFLLDDSPVQSEVQWTPFSLEEVLEEVQKAFFPKLCVRPRIGFGKMVRLAYIEKGDLARAYLMISSIFNHPETPEFVIRYIVKHELLHLVVPGRVPDGKKKESQHPPEFFWWENKIAPERGAAWQWMSLNFYGALKRMPRKEQHVIKKSSFRGLRWAKRVSMADCEKFFKNCEQQEARIQELI